MYVRMTQDHTYDVEGDGGITRRIPAGWTGDLDDEVAREVIELGRGVNAGKAAEKPSEKDEGEEAKPARAARRQ